MTVDLHAEGKTAILIDGHHVFVGVLQQTDVFFGLLREDHILRSMPFLTKYLEKFRIDTGKDGIEVFEKSLTAVDYADIAFRDLLLSGLSFFANTAGGTEVCWFDAEMPPRDQVLHNMRNGLQRQQGSADHFARDDKVVPFGTKAGTSRHLKLLEQGQYEFYVDGSCRPIVPYDLKNEFIQEMHQQWTYWPVKAGLGRRYFKVNKEGVISSQEKEVDALMSLQAADIARDPSYSHVVLVTNDGDHVPAVKRLKRGGKHVNIFSIIGYQSKDLQQTIGKENCITLAAARQIIDRSDEMRSAYGMDFSKEISRCPLFWSLESRLMGDLPWLATTGMTAIQFARSDAERHIHEKFGISAELLASARAIKPETLE